MGGLPAGDHRVEPGRREAAQENPDLRGTATKDKTRTFVNISLKGDDDDTILNNYKAIEPT